VPATASGPAPLIYAVGACRINGTLVFTWPTNAELVADVASLYLHPGMRVLDPTYGRGIWWQRWAPDPSIGGELVAHDKAIDGVDFRDLPYADDVFDAAVFDPEYAPSGGHDTSTVKSIQVNYGRGDGAKVKGAKTAEGCQAQMHEGLAEVARVVRPGGLVLAKSQPYIWNNHYWDGSRKLANHAEAIGLVLVDRFVHVTNPKPQPKLSICRHCRVAILRRGDGTWAARKRGPRGQATPQARAVRDVLNRTCLVARAGHDPAPEAARQSHAHNNYSVLDVYRVPAPVDRPRRTPLFGGFDDV
jgi:hypothetical protein